MELRYKYVRTLSSATAAVRVLLEAARLSLEGSPLAAFIWRMRYVAVDGHAAVPADQAHQGGDERGFPEVGVRQYGTSELCGLATEQEAVSALIVLLLDFAEHLQSVAVVEESLLVASGPDDGSLQAQSGLRDDGEEGLAAQPDNHQLTPDNARLAPTL